jgi:hypothetical protein
VAAKGSATFTAASGSKHYFEFEAYAQKPDIFVYVVFGPTGTPVLRIILMGDEVTVVDYGQKVFLTGHKDRLDMARLPVPLTLTELLAILTGSLPAPPVKAEAKRLGSERDPKSEVLVTDQNGVPYQITVDGYPESPAAPVLKLLKTQTSLGEALVVAFSDQKSVVRRDNQEAVLFPHKITATLGGSNNRRVLDIRYSTVALGAVRPREVFFLERPTGFASEEL